MVKDNNLVDLLKCGSQSDPDIKKNFLEILLHLLSDITIYPIICEKSRTVLSSKITSEYSTVVEKCIKYKTVRSLILQ